MNATDEISNLIKTFEWGELSKIRHESENFNLFNLFQDNLCENSWSRFLKYLFTSDESHKLGTCPFRLWLKVALPDCFKQTMESLPPNFETNAKFNWPTPEGRYLDLLIEIKNANHKVIKVIGIENKVWSGEGRKQLGDYQTAITEKYDCESKLVFLTPEGNDPTTHDNASRCLCVPCSYKTITTMCEEINKIMPEESELKILLSSMRNFINQQILGIQTMNPEAKKLVRSLYQDEKHRRVLKDIRDYNPGLEMAEDLKKAIEGSFVKIGKPDWDWGYHPGRCEEKGVTPQEIKLHPKEFYERADKLKFTIVYMLHSDRKNPDIDDEYRMFVGAWAEVGSGGLKAAKIFAEKLAFKEPRNAPNFPDWKFFWEGRNYKLQDFGQKDIDNLKSIFIEALEETYDRIAANFVEFFKQQ